MPLSHVCEHHALTAGNVHFGSKEPQIFSPPSAPMRRVLDPVWECGLGFGEVKRSRKDLRLSWEEPAFSFVAEDRCFLDDLQQSLLQLPDPVALPKPVLELGKGAAVQVPQLPRPKLRRLAQWKPQDSQAERQAALSKWS